MIHRTAIRLRDTVVAVALVGAIGCDGGEDAGDRSAAARAVAADSATATVFESEETFPLPFRTTLPPGFDAAVEETGVDNLAGAIRFTDGREDEAFLRLVMLDDRMDRNDAVGLVRSIATDFGVIGSQGLEYHEATPPPDHPWAITAYRLRGLRRAQAVEGWISLGEHDGRFYYLQALVPYGAADLLATYDRILAAWRWIDDGALTPLAPAAQLSTP